MERIMIVDAHASLDRVKYPVERLLKTMRASHIGNAVVFADANARNIEEQNEYVLRVAREHSLIPFYYIGGNPHTDTRPDSIPLPDHFDEYAGVRWHRWVGEDVDRDGRLDRDELDWAIALMESAEFEAFAAAAAHYDLPVIVEESLAVTVEMVLRYPSLDFIIPHLGSRNGGEANVIRALWDTPNAYFTTSLGVLDETILQTVASDRLFFSSGFPYGDPEAEVDKIDRMPIPEDVKEAIYGENVLSLLSHAAVNE
jgi:Tat protein secretion system quality control protein TatD with DNase activity